MMNYEEATREIPLPFIHKGKRGRSEIIECYWDVTSTGDYAADHALGQRYALDFMEHDHRTARVLSPPRITLVAIVADMVKQGVDIRNDPVASGFLYAVNNISEDLWSPAVLTYWRATYEREHTFMEKFTKERAAERSANARKAALAGAAKRRKGKRKAKREKL